LRRETLNRHNLGRNCGGGERGQQRQSREFVPWKNVLSARAG
jgi:hypothetical protein